MQLEKEKKKKVKTTKKAKSTIFNMETNLDEVEPDIPNQIIQAETQDFKVIQSTHTKSQALEPTLQYIQEETKVSQLNTDQKLADTIQSNIHPKQQKNMDAIGKEPHKTSQIEKKQIQDEVKKEDIAIIAKLQQQTDINIKEQVNPPAINELLRSGQQQPISFDDLDMEIKVIQKKDSTKRQKPKKKKQTKKAPKNSEIRTQDLFDFQQESSLIAVPNQQTKVEDIATPPLNIQLVNAKLQTEIIVDYNQQPSLQCQDKLQRESPLVQPSIQPQAVVESIQHTSNDGQSNIVSDKQTFMDNSNTNKQARQDHTQMKDINQNLKELPSKIEPQVQKDDILQLTFDADFVKINITNTQKKGKKTGKLGKKDIKKDTNKQAISIQFSKDSEQLNIITEDAEKQQNSIPKINENIDENDNRDTQTKQSIITQQKTTLHNQPHIVEKQLQNQIIQYNQNVSSIPETQNVEKNEINFKDLQKQEQLPLSNNISDSKQPQQIQQIQPTRLDPSLEKLNALLSIKPQKQLQMESQIQNPPEIILFNQSIDELSINTVPIKKNTKKNVKTKPKIKKQIIMDEAMKQEFMKKDITVEKEQLQITLQPDQSGNPNKDEPIQSQSQHIKNQSDIIEMNKLSEQPQQHQQIQTKQPIIYQTQSNFGEINTEQSNKSPNIENQSADVLQTTPSKLNQTDKITPLDIIQPIQTKLVQTIIPKQEIDCQKQLNLDFEDINIKVSVKKEGKPKNSKKSNKNKQKTEKIYLGIMEPLIENLEKEEPLNIEVQKKIAPIQQILVDIKISQQEKPFIKEKETDRKIQYLYQSHQKQSRQKDKQINQRAQVKVIPKSTVQSVKQQQTIAPTCQIQKEANKKIIMDQLVGLIRFHNNQEIRVMRDRMLMLEEDILSRLQRSQHNKRDRVEVKVTRSAEYESIVEQNIALQDEFRMHNQNIVQNQQIN